MGALTQLIAHSLVQKWEAAQDNLDKMQDAFQQLSANIDNEWPVEWTRLEATAMQERGRAMEIYDVALTKGEILGGTVPIFAESLGTNQE